MIESAAVTYNKEAVYMVDGDLHEVEFSFCEMWKYIKNKETYYPYLLHLYHVHPAGFLQYSDKDRKAAKALNLGLGYSPLFSIIVFNTDSQADIEHSIVTYQYKKDDASMIKIDQRYVPYPIPDALLFSLKGMSYQHELPR